MAQDAKDKQAKEEKRGIVERFGVVKSILGAIGAFLALVAAVWFPLAAAYGWWPYDTKPPDVRIIDAQFDAPGDNDAENLNGEWVQIKNLEDDEVDMSGWTLCDLGNNHVYQFGGYALPAGGTVKVYTGSGTDSQTELYWRSERCIWNNGGDTATLEDVDGVFVDDYTE